MTGKIGIIGDKDSVLGFMAVGFSVFSTEDVKEAEDILENAKNDGFSVMYITEDLLKDLGEIYDKFKTDPDIAIIPIPSKKGSLGIGLNNIKRSVERAVGADILKD